MTPFSNETTHTVGFYFLVGYSALSLEHSLLAPNEDILILCELRDRIVLNSLCIDGV